MSKPRALFVSRTRYRLPLAPGVAAKFAALREELEVHVLASAAPGSEAGDDTFVLVPALRPRSLDGVAFWLSLPWRVAGELRRLRPHGVVCQTAYEGAAVVLARRLARSDARLVIEVHGDWRTSTRLYGSGRRRLLSGLGDRLAAWALRRADAVRTVSPFTAGLVRALGVEPAADFPAYMDLDPFLTPPQPLPARPVALFVGVLERYKNVDGLAEAWRLAAPQLPDASLRVVGKGSKVEIVERLVREHGVRWDSDLSAAEVAKAMDEAWAVVLPSRSEGMGRVLVEAFCRGRAVVGSRAGSIPDLVEDGVTGILARPDEPAALAAALVRVLGDRALAERLGTAAEAAAERWVQTPAEYARRTRELVA